MTNEIEKLIDAVSEEKGEGAVCAARAQLERLQNPRCQRQECKRERDEVDHLEMKAATLRQERDEHARIRWEQAGSIKTLADTLDLLKARRVQLLSDERAAVDAALRTAGRMP